MEVACLSYRLDMQRTIRSNSSQPTRFAERRAMRLNRSDVVCEIDRSGLDQSDTSLCSPVEALEGHLACPAGRNGVPVGQELPHLAP